MVSLCVCVCVCVCVRARARVCVSITALSAIHIIFKSKPFFVYASLIHNTQLCIRERPPSRRPSHTGYFMAFSRFETFCSESFIIVCLQPLPSTLPDELFVDITTGNRFFLRRRVYMCGNSSYKATKSSLFSTKELLYVTFLAYYASWPGTHGFAMHCYSCSSSRQYDHVLQAQFVDITALVCKLSQQIVNALTVLHLRVFTAVSSNSLATIELSRIILNSQT